MRFSEHFARFRGLRPDRAGITLEMCESVVAAPLESLVQDDGRTAYWSHVAVESRHLKVIVTAHWDRGFRRRVERRRREGR